MKRNGAIIRSKRFWIIILAVLIVAVAAAVICSQWLGKDGQDDPKKGYEIIQSQYVDWSIPSECMTFLKYENEVNGNVVSDMFNMQVGAEEVPIFRFDFGDENAGDWLGLLTVDGVKIPVVYTVFVTSDEELSALGDSAADRYYMLMDVFNELVQDLNENTAFTSERLLDVGEDREIEMTYWDVTLPGKVTVQEINEDGDYEAIFSGEVVGEMVLLYHVTIGNEQSGTFQGYFELDGVKKAVYAEAYELGERATWTENDYETAYCMMDTINEVLAQIRSNKHYSAK